MMEPDSSSAQLLPKYINRRIGRAMHDYTMLEDGDRVLIGVSGGVDSSVLSWILPIWEKKAPISFYLEAVYIDNGFWKPEYGGDPPQAGIRKILGKCGIPMTPLKGRKVEEEDLTCYLCARNRRSQLFDYAKEKNFNKIALGHHKDDLIETFFLNMMFSGNISTMVPKQRLFDGELHIIRPLAYLEKKDVVYLAEMVEISSVKNYCPMEKDTRRERVREILSEIYAKEPNAKASLFQSLGNVREGYML